MKIIDFHTHVFPDKIAHGTISALSSTASIEPHSDGTISGLLKRMEEGQVDISVNLPVLTRATQFNSILNFAKEINSSSFGDKRIISFAGIHPEIEDYEKALDIVKSEGFLGIKIHPDYQGTFFDDEKYVKILSYAKKLDLITVTHAGLDGAFIGQEIKCTPKRVLNLLSRIGGYDKLVLAHMGGNELSKDVLDNLAGESVYFDTSYVLPYIGQDAFEKILAKHGENKILFATDSPWQSTKNMVDILKGYRLGDSVERKILYENGKKLLNI